MQHQQRQLLEYQHKQQKLFNYQLNSENDCLLSKLDYYTLNRMNNKLLGSKANGKNNSKMVKIIDDDDEMSSNLKVNFV